MVDNNLDRFIVVNTSMNDLHNSIDAVGVWFYSVATKRYLYLMRNDVKHSQCWSLPGGKVEEGESLMTTMTRECEEEIGSMPAYKKIIPLEKFTSTDNKFCYHTFFCVVEEEFKPILNEEHYGYAWIDSVVTPRPMHPGLWATINFSEVQSKIATVQQHFTHHNS